MKNKLTVRVLAEIAIFAAVAFALDYLQGGIWKGAFLNGGSIGLAMVPVFIIAYRRGLVPGLLCGLVLSIVQMIPGIYVINSGSIEQEWLQTVGPFIQVMLDYVLAYTVTGFAGAFAGNYHKAETKGQKILWVVIGVVVGGLLKYAMHTLAGIFFWPGEMWGVSGAAYSFLYNGLYCIPNIVIAVIVMIIIVCVYPQFLEPKEAKGITASKDAEKKNENVKEAE